MELIKIVIMRNTIMDRNFYVYLDEGAAEDMVREIAELVEKEREAQSDSLSKEEVDRKESLSVPGLYE